MQESTASRSHPEEALTGAKAKGLQQKSYRSKTTTIDDFLVLRAN